MKKANYSIAGRMKRAAVLLLTVLLCIGLCGCSTFFDMVDSFLGGSDQPGNQETLPPVSNDPTKGPQATEPAGTEPAQTGAPAQTTEPTEVCGIGGTVVASVLNIRKGPGTGYDTVGSLSSGDPVLILEMDIEGEIPWARISQGWICMDHVKLDAPEVLRPTTVENMGVVIEDSVPVFRGPGEHYDRVDALSRYHRVEVLGFCGQWICVQEGWVPMGKVYIDGTLGEEEPVSVTVIGDLLNVRSGPGTQYRVVGGISYGQKVQVLYQLTIDDVTWGCTDMGWISMDYVSTVQDISILGTWFCVRSWNLQPGYLLEPPYYIEVVTFEKDGSLDLQVYCMSQASEEPVKSDYYEWIPSHGGKYTFDGRLLNTCDAGIENESLWVGQAGAVEFYFRGNLEDAVASIRRVQDPVSVTVTTEQLRIRKGPGTQYEAVGTITKGQKLEVFYQETVDGVAWGYTELGWICMDYVTTAEDVSILGTWYCIRGWGMNLDCYFEPPYQIEIATFHENGTLEWQVYRMDPGAEVPVRSDEAPWLSTDDGKYTISNQMMGAYDVRIENDVLFVAWAGATEFYHRGGIEEAVKAINQAKTPAS